ncbi:MAG: hypothetical protein HKN68_11850 [Saprospiraceae bacterium]|nr:hypothetical protein [Saprospiraceae bacterium]
MDKIYDSQRVRGLKNEMMKAIELLKMTYPDNLASAPIGINLFHPGISC